MLVWRNGKLLLIERKKPPFGFAPPAGHVDGRKSFEDAAQSELQEEVGLCVKELELVAEGRRENPCRRENGTWHYWKVFHVSAFGEINASKCEVKRFIWCSAEDLRALRRRTEDFLAGKISQAEWEERPGLEPVWSEFLTELHYFEDRAQASEVVVASLQSGRP
jgi:ADP-ribose pyrophosphatase YjhB (NUDIX family)